MERLPVARQRRASALNVGDFRDFRTLEATTELLQPLPLRFTVAPETRGLALKSLKLKKGFDGLLGGIFNRAKKVYFVAWAWDYSGQPVNTYPGKGISADRCLIRIKAGDIREFIGAGTVLLPARTVNSGISVRLQLWQSKADVRQFGKTMAQIAKTIQDSDLNRLLTAAALVTGGTTATIALAKDAGTELAGLIGQILQTTTDDFVDYFDGSYPASEPWAPPDDRSTGFASEIVLRKFS